MPLPTKSPISIAELRDALLPLYGPIDSLPRLAPLDELVFTVLTQHTSDRNAERAFTELKRRFPTWHAVANAEPEEISNAIRSGGLANQKGRRIKEILQIINERLGEYDLQGIGSLHWQRAREWLMELPGVGIKSASVVIGFAFGAPAMPVDTHIYRVSQRLALIDTSVSVEQAHYILEELVAEEQRFELHVLLITHGRQICKARKPLCQACALQNKCPSARSC